MLKWFEFVTVSDYLVNSKCIHILLVLMGCNGKPKTIAVCAGHFKKLRRHWTSPKNKPNWKEAKLVTQILLSYWSFDWRPISRNFSKKVKFAWVINRCSVHSNICRNNDQNNSVSSVIVAALLALISVIQRSVIDCPLNALLVMKWATSWENLSSGVWDQVRLKPACSAAETSWRLKMSDIETGHIILSR